LGGRGDGSGGWVDGMAWQGRRIECREQWVVGGIALRCSCLSDIWALALALYQLGEAGRAGGLVGRAVVSVGRITVTVKLLPYCDKQMRRRGGRGGWLWEDKRLAFTLSRAPCARPFPIYPPLPRAVE